MKEVAPQGVTYLIFTFMCNKYILFYLRVPWDIDRLTVIPQTKRYVPIALSKLNGYDSEVFIVANQFFWPICSCYNFLLRGSIFKICWNILVSMFNPQLITKFVYVIYYSKMYTFDVSSFIVLGSHLMAFIIANHNFIVFPYHVLAWNTVAMFVPSPF